MSSQNNTFTHGGNILPVAQPARLTLDLRLQALDLTLAVGDCLFYDSHWVFPGAVIVRRSTRSGFGRGRPMGSILAQR